MNQYEGKWAIVGDYIVWLNDENYVTCAYEIRSPVRRLIPVDQYGKTVTIKKENLRNGMNRGKYFLR